MRPAFVYKADRQRGRQWAERLSPRGAAASTSGSGPTSAMPHDVRYLAAWEPPADLARSSRTWSCCSPPAPASTSSTSPSLPPQLPRRAHGGAGHRAGHGRVRDARRARPAPRHAARTAARSSSGNGSRCRCGPRGSARVGVLGLGSLGQAVLAQLVALGFDCAGWSRSRRDSTRRALLCRRRRARSASSHARDILVCLLPLTAPLAACRTRRCSPGCHRARAWCTRVAARTSWLPTCCAALDGGQLAEAVLDVMRPRAAAEATSPLASPSRVAHAAHRQRDAGGERRGRPAGQPSPPGGPAARRSGRPGPRLLSFAHVDPLQPRSALSEADHDALRTACRSRAQKRQFSRGTGHKSERLRGGCMLEWRHRFDT